MDLSRRPLRIALIRHGESEANLDKSIFERVPDHAIPLTQHGREQAAQAGRELHELFEDEPVRSGTSSTGSPMASRGRTSSTFLETMHRDFEAPDSPRNVLLVSHGLTMRLFCMRWFHWSVQFFETLRNPGNAETRVLLRQPDFRYKLDRPFEQWCEYEPTERERSAWL